MCGYECIHIWIQSVCRCRELRSISVEYLHEHGTSVFQPGIYGYECIHIWIQSVCSSRELRSISVKTMASLTPCNELVMATLLEPPVDWRAEKHLHQHNGISHGSSVAEKLRSIFVNSSSWPALFFPFAQTSQAEEHRLS